MINIKHCLCLGSAKSALLRGKEANDTSESSRYIKTDFEPLGPAPVVTHGARTLMMPVRPFLGSWRSQSLRCWGFLSSGTAHPCHTRPLTVGQGGGTAWICVHGVNTMGWREERQYCGVFKLSIHTTYELCYYSFMSVISYTHLSMNFVITPSRQSYTLTFAKTKSLLLNGLLT